MTTHAFRETGISVRLYRRGARTWTAAFRIAGRKVQRSTGEEAKDPAIAAAKRMVRDELRKELLDITPGEDLTWSQLFDLYERDRIPHMQPKWARTSKTRLRVFEDYFGSETLVMDLDQADIDRYVHVRTTTGALSPPGYRREQMAVTSGTVGADLRWLSTVIRWAMRRKVGGQRLLSLNPLDGLDRPGKNKNPKRPITSEERYAKTMAMTDEVDPQGRLRCMLALARFTGHRINAISHLRISDILFSTDDVGAALAERGADVRLAEHFPHGAVRWSAEHDKSDLGWITPMSPQLSTELQLYRRRDRHRIGDAPLFPATKNPAESFHPTVAGRWLLRAEKKAALPKLAGGIFHPYRRLFATELAHVPAKVAAALGGWKDPKTMQAIYQQPAGSALYSAALEVGQSQ